MHINIFDPATILAIAGVAGGVITGSIYIVGLITGTRTQNKKDELNLAKNSAEFVIDSLERKVKVLQDQMADQTKQIGELTKQIHQLIGENKILKDLLQGRDENTVVFQQMGMEAMTKTVPILMETTQKTNENVERLAKSIEKHLIQQERKQVVTVTTQPVNNSTA